jgi:hypothetical protein
MAGPGAARVTTCLCIYIYIYTYIYIYIYIQLILFAHSVYVPQRISIHRLTRTLAGRAKKAHAVTPARKSEDHQKMHHGRTNKCHYCEKRKEEIRRVAQRDKLAF